MSFTQKNDPLVNSVKQIMEKANRDREIEQKLCEKLGIYSRKSVPHDKVHVYDAMLKDCLLSEEKLDEISAAKLGTYVKKASDDKESSIKKSEQQVWNKSKNPIDYSSRIAKRKSGINTAKEKLGVGYKVYGAKVPATVKEEEQLDEISAAKLGTYVKNAADDKENARDDADQERYYGANDDAAKSMSRANKRTKGIRLALKKLGVDPHGRNARKRATVVKEEEQLDEISASKVGRYIRKAIDDKDETTDSRTMAKYNNKDTSKHTSKILRRMRGLGKAADKLGFGQRRGEVRVPATVNEVKKEKEDDNDDKKIDKSRLLTILRKPAKKKTEINEASITALNTYFKKAGKSLKKLDDKEVNKRSRFMSLAKDKVASEPTPAKVKATVKEENSFDSIMNEIRQNLGEKKFIEISEAEDDTANSSKNSTPTGGVGIGMRARSKELNQTGGASTVEPPKNIQVSVDKAPPVDVPKMSGDQIDRAIKDTPSLAPPSTNVPAATPNLPLMARNNVPQPNISSGPAPARVPTPPVRTTAPSPAVAPRPAVTRVAAPAASPASRPATQRPTPAVRQPMTVPTDDYADRLNAQRNDSRNPSNFGARRLSESAIIEQIMNGNKQ